MLRRALDPGKPEVTVEILRLGDGEIGETLARLLGDGGCAGVIVNTVSRAQQLARMLAERFGTDAVRLLHSRFTATNRIEKERALRGELGKPGPGVTRPLLRIVVGTQVIEQSRDIDFDVMITDLCPMDLLLQRLGRLHRHANRRPAALSAARCYVLGAEEPEPEPGSAGVYGPYLLLRTRALLPGRITLPTDISALVQAVYGGQTDLLPALPEGYEAARAAWEAALAGKERRAEAFRIYPPWKDRRATIVGWLDAPVTDAAGEAAVRDAADSLEVTAVRRDADGALRLLSDGRALPRTGLDDAVAKRIARECLRLPPVLCRRDTIDDTIAALEAGGTETAGWQASPWLKGSLFLLFNGDNEARLLGWRLHYDGFYGLTCEKEADMDG